MKISHTLKRCVSSVRIGRSRCFTNVPFHDDLGSVDNEEFNLLDFEKYQPAEGKVADHEPKRQHDKPKTLKEIAFLEKPFVLKSKIRNPFLNLAIEDYLFNTMPTSHDQNFNRLLFYTNSPCVVIGKNQNPWSEVNLPLLNSLHIPLVRRRSGGGTVVHDLGNVNFSLITTKSAFDRHKFGWTVARAVNSLETPVKLEVNEKGDIVTTQKNENGVNCKVSGSAYKISKGRSYHHGTMLLNLQLDVLKKLLARDESKLGKVDSMASIKSISSPVVNVGIENDEFIDAVTQEFQKENEPPMLDDNYIEQTEFLGLGNFTKVGTEVASFTIDETIELPEEVTKVVNDLMSWDFQYGNTPKFTHELHNTQLGFKVKFSVGKHTIVQNLELEFDKDRQSLLSESKVKESFEMLHNRIKEGDLQYHGSAIAGFVTNDIISDWVGLSIDGSI